MKISLIAAMTANNVIGRKGGMPWDLPADMKHFVKTTKGHTVIMGRKTFESIGSKALPNRFNIVVTGESDFESKHDGIEVVNSLESALEFAKMAGSKEVFVIGGGELYKQAIEKANKLYMTLIDTVIDGDTTFPDINENVWRETLRVNRIADENNEYNLSFVEFIKA